MLRVNRDSPAAGEFPKINMVCAAGKSQIHSVVQQAFTEHSLAYADFVQQIHGALLEHAGPHALFAILPAARFKHHGLNTL